MGHFVLRVAVGLFGLLRRLALALAAATLAVFIMIELSFPGGFEKVVLPLGTDPSNPEHRDIVDTYRLDQGIFGRYVGWWSDAIGGDWGRSTWNGGPVWDLVGPRLPISAELMMVGLGLAALIGIPLGILAVLWRGRWIGRLIDVSLGLSQAIPVFVTAPFLVYFFAVKLRWLPAGLWSRPSDPLGDHLRHLALPAIAIALAEIGTLGRVIRADLERILEEDFMTAARAKGLGSIYLLCRHAVRPASYSLVNIAAIRVGALLSGTIVVELIFGIGGMGQLLLRATLDRDLNMLLALTTYMVIIFVTLNWLADVVMRWLDPRIVGNGIQR